MFITLDFYQKIKLKETRVLSYQVLKDFDLLAKKQITDVIGNSIR